MSDLIPAAQLVKRGQRSDDDSEVGRGGNTIHKGDPRTNIRGKGS